MKIVRLFDPEQAGTADHSRLEDTEALKLISYLDSGAVVLSTTATIQDAIEPEQGQVVPLGFRTDGQWVWCDATRYYLQRHRIAPDPEFAEAVRQRGYARSTVDDGLLAQALAALRGA